MSSTQRQNADGSWSPAEPIGYQPGLDWEVYDRAPGLRSRHVAKLFDKEVNLAKVEARWRWLLARRMAEAEKRVQDLLAWARDRDGRAS